MRNLIQESKKHLENGGMSPQDYKTHRDFALENSFILVIAGLKGIAHGFLPFAYPNVASSTLIRSFKKLVDSGRHKNEINGTK